MTDQDLPFVARLYATTRAGELAATGWTPEAKAAFLDQQHNAQHSHYRATYAGAEWLILEKDGEPDRPLYLAQGEEALLLVDISLLPEWTGQGIGGAILTDLIARGRKERRPIGLHVEKRNPAQFLYRRLGFAFVEDKGIYDRMEWRP